MSRDHDSTTHLPCPTPGSPVQGEPLTVRRAIRTALGLLAAAIVLSSSALAQDFSGTFLGTSDAGPVTVVLTMTGEDIAGSLTAQGVEFALEGFVQEGVGVGWAYTAEGSVGFEAYLEGETLGLYLFEMDANGAPIVESAIELIMTRQAVAAPGGSQANNGMLDALGSPAEPSAVPAGPVIATGAYGSLTQDNAMAFIDALEFVLAQIGYAYTFTDAERAEALRSIATSYPSMAQMDQVVLSQARDIWQRVQENWPSASQSEQREFALGVLILAFGEQTVSAWVGQSGGGGQSLGGGASCTTFEDCTSSFVDEGTWSDTFNAQGCWAAAGCGGFDASTNTFDYESY